MQVNKFQNIHTYIQDQKICGWRCEKLQSTKSKLVQIVTWMYNQFEIVSKSVTCETIPDTQAMNVKL